jgi:G3E family GTPase
VERPVVIHGVQHLFHPPGALDAWPDSDRRSRIVFITQNLDEARVRQVLGPFLPIG